MSLIEFKDVTKTYQMGEQLQTVLHGITFSIARGELVAIVGESGSGKSTIMNILGLLDTPCAGQYYLGGRDVSTLTDNQMGALRNKMIGFVFQQFYLLPKLSALENVALPLHYLGVPKKTILTRAMAYLEKVGMADRVQHRPHELSGGQQQRVAIARSLVCSPTLILADEPTGALDSATSKEVISLFKTLHQEENRTILLITHNPSVAKACDRCLTVKDGRLMGEG